MWLLVGLLFFSRDLDSVNSRRHVCTHWEVGVEKLMMEGCIDEFGVFVEEADEGLEGRCGYAVKRVVHSKKMRISVEYR